MANRFKWRYLLSDKTPVLTYTVLTGVTVKEGDPVKIDLGTGNVELVAADGVQMLGWALHDAAAGEELKVLLAYPGVQVSMPIVSGTTWSDTMKGHLYSIEGSTGAYTAGLADTDHDLLIAVEQDRDVDGNVWVEVNPACFELGGKEPV